MEGWEVCWPQDNNETVSHPIENYLLEDGDRQIPFNFFIHLYCDDMESNYSKSKADARRGIPHQQSETLEFVQIEPNLENLFKVTSFL